MGHDKYDAHLLIFLFQKDIEKRLHFRFVQFIPFYFRVGKAWDTLNFTHFVVHVLAAVAALIHAELVHI